MELTPAIYEQVHDLTIAEQNELLISEFNFVKLVDHLIRNVPLSRELTFPFYLLNKIYKPPNLNK